MIVTVPKTRYSIYGLSVHSGNFAVVASRCTWNSCREQFHRALSRSKTKDFFFAFSNGQKDSIINFIREIERRANVPEKITFQDTDRDTVMCIKPGQWWAQQNIRLSLLTILLRCGQNYKGDFISALFSLNYTKQTKIAIDRFMDGNTHYRGRANMWHNEFSNYNRKRVDYVERILVKKPITVSEKSIIEAKKITKTSGVVSNFLETLIAEALDKAVEEGYTAGRDKWIGALSEKIAKR